VFAIFTKLQYLELCLSLEGLYCRPHYTKT